MLSYHGLAHLRPFFRPKVFCCLRRPRHQYAPGSPSPLYVALPAPSAPWLPKSMAAFDKHLEGVHPTNATHSVPPGSGVPRACGAGKARSLSEASTTVPPCSGRCVSLFPIRQANNDSQPPPTSAALSAAPVCGMTDKSLCGTKTLSRQGKRCRPSACRPDAQVLPTTMGARTTAWAFVNPNTAKGPEANLLVDITSNGGATD